MDSSSFNMFPDMQELQSSPSDEEFEKINAEMEFNMIFCCVQSNFIRLRWKIKLQLIDSFIGILTDLESIKTVVDSLYDTLSGKNMVYANVIFDSNFVYDKILHDHNRAIHPSSLNETIKDELRWFERLPTSRQVLVVLGLARIGSGGIIRLTYQRALRRYNELLLEKSQAEIRNKLDGKDLPVPDFETKNVEADVYTDEEANQEVEEQRKLWNDMIAKYRIEVEGKPKKAKAGKGGVKQKDKKKGKKDAASSKSKSSKSSKKSKGTNKSKKGSKSSAKSKKGAKGKNEELDYVQMLPIWTVMKIFGYLEPKVLQKIKAVNSYWECIADIVLEEKKARKQLDKLIEKVEADIDFKYVDQGAQPKVAFYKLSDYERRANRAAWRGAAHRSLVNDQIRTGDLLVESGVYTECYHQMREEFDLPVQFLTIYPKLRETNVTVRSKFPTLSFDFTDSDYEHGSVTISGISKNTEDGGSSNESIGVQSIVNMEICHANKSDW